MPSALFFSLEERISVKKWPLTEAVKEHVQADCSACFQEVRDVNRSSQGAPEKMGKA